MRAMNLDGTITMDPEYPGPNGLMELFDDAVSRQNSADAAEVVMAMMEDVRDSAMLAAFASFQGFLMGTGMSGPLAASVARELSEGIGLTVDDFLTNNYGDL